MKIKKKNNAVNACDAVIVTDDVAVGVPTAGTVCKYDEALCHIQSAIELLAANAKDDTIAKESIANLSVVLMDLKSNC